MKRIFVTVINDSIITLITVLSSYTQLDDALFKAETLHVTEFYTTKIQIAFDG